MSQEKVAVLITVPANDITKTEQALSQCNSLVEAGTQIDHLFFYFDGVFNALEDAPFHEQWVSFSQQHHIPLIACSTLAQKRNLPSRPNDLFAFAGLSEFYTRLHHCQRVVNI